MSVSPTPWIAFTREVSGSIVDCELTHLARAPIRVDVARAQHRGYERLLTSLGCEVRRVAPAPEHPDAVFIEDTAVVLDEVAVLCRPGAKSRRGEVSAVHAALEGLRAIVRIKAPATLDGGDVLVVGRTVHVGRTTRTNEQGIAQLTEALAPFGYVVRGVPVTGCLHLKSAVTALADDTLLLNPQWVDPSRFAGLRVETVDASEPMAANVLRVGHELIHGTAYQRTRERIEHLGFAVKTIDITELAKAEGAVTCCSLLLRR